MMKKNFISRGYFRINAVNKRSTLPSPGKISADAHVCPVTMTTIRHCFILDFGRGAYNQADAPGITRPLYATECMQTLFLRRWQETKSKRTHTAFRNIFTMVHEHKDKNALEIGYQHFKRSPNSSIFVIEYQSFTKFSIRWPISRYIL